MIKRFVLYILYIVGVGSTFIYPITLHKWLKLLFLKINSYRISSQFKMSGKHVFIGSSVKIVGGKNISLEDNVVIEAQSTISVVKGRGIDNYVAEILIGKGTAIGEYAHITAINKITIGQYVLMGKNVTITDNGHGGTSLKEIADPPIRRLLISKGAIKIGDNVWIGDKVTILPCVTIADNVIVGANSVVTKSFPKNSIIAGNPAKIIGFFE